MPEQSGHPFVRHHNKGLDWTCLRLCKLFAGQGEGFCGEQRFQVRAGDVVVFPPQSLHGIDVSEDARMYCLELMQPNDMFAGERSQCLLLARWYLMRLPCRKALC